VVLLGQVLSPLLYSPFLRHATRQLPRAWHVAWCGSLGLTRVYGIQPGAGARLWKAVCGWRAKLGNMQKLLSSSNAASAVPAAASVRAAGAWPAASSRSPTGRLVAVDDRHSDQALDTAIASIWVVLVQLRKTPSASAPSFFYAISVHCCGVTWPKFLGSRPSATSRTTPMPDAPRWSMMFSCVSTGHTRSRRSRPHPAIATHSAFR
jgi:hypothetical protein